MWPRWAPWMCLFSALVAVISGQDGVGQEEGVPQALTAERKIPLTADAPVGLRCAFTQGTWCKDFFAQQAIPWKAPPRGSKDCPVTKWGMCNNVGNCNHDTGYCECTAGWRGPSCEIRQKRPCTDGYSDSNDESGVPRSHLDANKRDRDLTKYGWTYSRCAGICDDDLAACYCDGPMGRIEAPAGSPPGTPPIQRGRPLITPHMAPTTLWDGRKAAHGEQKYEDVYGPRGYCNVSKPQWSASCSFDDLNGFGCDIVTEAFCPNQCSGHGYCNLGYCKCDTGYYGHDCARRKAGLPLLPSRILQESHLVASVVDPPAAMEPPPKPQRLRPLIYVYDLEPLYGARMLQYRLSSTWCVHRRYNENNVTFFTDNWVYAADTLIHEALLQSEHRTFDPEEADFFYVPHMASCYPFPIMNWADYPWFPAHGGPRVMHASNIVKEAVEFVDAQYPFWKRRGGRDHVFLFTHDEGACWAPTLIKDSIWLTHWGRMDVNHTSNSAFVSDSYSQEFKCRKQPNGWLAGISGHPCYNPVKDLVVPQFKAHTHYGASGLAGRPARERDILLFFRGDIGRGRLPNYSRGVRQKITKIAESYKDNPKVKVLVGYPGDIPGSYTDLLSRSRFCLVAAGDGWSGRMEDSMLHGCIPVIIMDNVHAVFESILNVEEYSMRIMEKDVPNIIPILQAVPEKKVRQMQAHIGRVWHRYRFAVGPALMSAVRQQLASNVEDAKRSEPQDVRDLAHDADGKSAGNGDALSSGSAARKKVFLPRPFRGDPTVDDAFATILQWLSSRIPYARGGAAPSR